MKWLNRFLPVGSRSVLWGVHCFFIHPWLVAWAWTKLYGFPKDWRLWACFFLHDLGYWGCPNMDGPEGERHPEWGAKTIEYLVTLSRPVQFPPQSYRSMRDQMWDTREIACDWHNFCLYHSRFYAKRAGVEPSRLCMADKLVPSLEPWWLYLPRAWASGELKEYLSMAGGKDGGKYAGEPNSAEVQRLLDLYTVTGHWRYWYQGMALFSKDYAYAHRDGGQDTWTQGRKP